MLDKNALRAENIWHNLITSWCLLTNHQRKSTSANKTPIIGDSGNYSITSHLFRFGYGELRSQLKNQFLHESNRFGLFVKIINFCDVSTSIKLNLRVFPFLIIV